MHGAPPGTYEHAPHDGLAVYMAMSRKVGSIDVGEGVLQMHAQAGEFIIGAQGAAARMHSFRGGHWIEVVLARASVGSTCEEVVRSMQHGRWPHRSFHKSPEVSDLLVRIVRSGLATGTPEPLHFDELGSSLAETLERFLTSEFKRRREVAPLPKRSVAEVLDYMDAHLAEPIALNDLAQLAGLSPTRFAKAFRNATGKSPYQALLRRRLEAARFSLMTGSASISEISLACGFSSQQHLTGLFSKKFGIAPGAFRNQIRIT